MFLSDFPIGMIIQGVNGILILFAGGPGEERCGQAGESANQECIPSSWFCDDEADCFDGSDEVGCGGMCIWLLFCLFVCITTWLLCDEAFESRSMKIVSSIGYNKLRV